MAKSGTGTGEASAVASVEAGAQDVVGDQEAPRSVAIAAAGVTTGAQFASLMSALMSDVIEGRISPVVSNAAVNAGGKLLKMVEMEYTHGQRGAAPVPAQQPTLSLVSGQ